MEYDINCACRICIVAVDELNVNKKKEMDKTEVNCRFWLLKKKMVFPGEMNRKMTIEKMNYPKWYQVKEKTLKVK